ncbi:MAG: dihydroneopterin aldolase [Verrucomicrobiales bacterium]|nr:dihydroneopterin aldolase [Verrucomicrobiales bacterium]
MNDFSEVDPPDQILIEGLEAAARVGVPDEERAGWQTLRWDLSLELETRFEDMADDLEKTVDYQAVAEGLRRLVAERPRRLIETLAEEAASWLLREFPLGRVTLTVRKRVLPGVDATAVRLTRKKPCGF